MAEHELNRIVDDEGEVFNLRDSTKQPVADRVTSWGSTPSDTKYPSEKLVKDDLDKKLDRYDARYVRGTQDGDGWVKLAETGDFTTTRQRDKPFVWDVFITSCQKETSTEQLCLNVRFEASGLPNVFFKRFYTIDRLNTHKFAVRVVGAAGSESGNIELWAYHENKWGTIAIRESVASESISLAPTKLYGTYYSYYDYGGTSKPESDLENNIQVVDSTNVKLQTDENLVTSWSSTTSDSRYPSEKLVKTSLDNIKLFQAEYGVTSFADIYAAITSNKIVYCKVSGRMAFLAYLSVSNPPTSSSFVEFQYYRSNSAGTGDSVFVYKITNNNNTWTTTERPTYVVSDWNAASGSASYIANKPTIPTELPVKIEEIGGSAVDLDSLTASDMKVHYYTWSNGNRGNVSHKPTDAVYTVKVFPCGAGRAGTYVMQEAYKRGSTERYVRRRSDGSTAWSDWQLCTYPVDDALSNTSENPVQNKVVTTALVGKVDSTDSRLLPNADEFVATYSTQSSGTTMEELITAYNAGKKISVLIGGAIGTGTYAMKVPLSYVRVQDDNIVGFYFETHVDPVRSTSLAGSMITYWRTSLGQSSGWGSTSGDVAYAVASSTAAVADAASDAVANSNLATMIAARMLANASNAESGALTALMAQLSKTLLGVTGGTEIVTSYPSDNGFDTSGHVNQPYRIKLSAIATYMASALIAGGSVATPPRVKVLDAPYYYQNGSASSNVKMHLASASASTYYSLGNRQNVSTKWGICNCPDGGSYVEIDFDISVILTTGDIQFSEIPYIMFFCATCHEDDGVAYTEIPSSDSYIFALANLTVGNISNSLYSYAHVRMCGYIPNVSGITGKAIFVGGCIVNGITGTNIAAVEMKNVKVISHTKTFGLT